MNVESGRYFLDTNILVYLFAPDEPEKQKIASMLVETALQREIGVISFQVVQEFMNVATKKFVKQLTPSHLKEFAQKVLFRLCKIHSSEALYQQALEIHHRLHFSLYDALIVVGGIASDCEVLFSEDLQHGQRIQGMKVINPFLQK